MSIHPLRLPGLLLLGLLSSAAAAYPTLPQPLLDGMEPAVAEQLQGARRDFEAFLREPELTAARAADAYGEIAQIYHAQNLQPSAEAAYRAAIGLNPAAFRWHYLLGYLLQQQARLDGAADAYTAALQLRPEAGRVLLRLAQVRLAEGQAAAARALFERALAVDPALEAIAAYGIGRAEVAADRSAQAIAWFERALAAEPAATRVHYALAMAWRRQGDVGAARRHLALRGEVEPSLPDALIDALTERTGGARVRQYRAMQAVAEERFADARREFQAIVDQSPQDARARVSLARVMVMTGDADAAAQQLQAAIAASPRDDHANYFYGRVLQDQAGLGGASVRLEQAAEHYRVALASNPEHAGAHFFLAGLLFEDDAYAAAARHYRRVAELMPERPDARRLLIASLAAAEDWAGARDAALAALDAQGENPGISLALARLLAASPDPAARNGERALSLSRALFDAVNSIENAEAVAMAYAELTQYRNAAAFQQAAIDAANAYGAYELIEGLQRGLALYSEERAMRRPWREPIPRFLAGALDAPF